MSRRALVCGSRTWSDKAILWGCLDALHQVDPFSVVIEGEASGADTLARQWAESIGIPVLKFPADWKGKGRAAGPIRNKQMLVEGQPDIVVSFSDDITSSRGTKNMITQAVKSNVPTVLVTSRKDSQGQPRTSIVVPQGVEVLYHD